MRFLTLRLYRTTIAYSQSIKIQSFYGNFFYFTMYLHEVWHGLLSIALVYCPWCNLRRNYSKLTTIAYSCLTTLIIKLSYGKCIKCEGATVNFGTSCFPLFTQIKRSGRIAYSLSKTKTL